MENLSHFDAKGGSRMVDVGGKEITERTARATGCVAMKPATLALIQNRRVAKGDVLEVARLAGIMAAKRTDELIPLCHSVPLSAAHIDFEFPAPGGLLIAATTKTIAQTGVEMEALVAVSTAALTIYDMCKSVDREMSLGPIRLEEKSGGRSGHFLRGSGSLAEDQMTRGDEGAGQDRGCATAVSKDSQARDKQGKPP